MVAFILHRTVTICAALIGAASLAYSAPIPYAACGIFCLYEEPNAVASSSATSSFTPIPIPSPTPSGSADLLEVLEVISGLDSPDGFDNFEASPASPTDAPAATATTIIEIIEIPPVAGGANPVLLEDLPTLAARENELVVPSLDKREEVILPGEI